MVKPQIYHSEVTLAKAKQDNGRMSEEAFVLQGIVTLRTGAYKGVHTRFSGFNDAFREYFPGSDPVAATKLLAEAGKIVIRPCKGGVMIYRPDEAPAASTAGKGRAALAKMGLAA